MLIPKDPATVEDEATKRLEAKLATNPSSQDTVVAMEDFIRELKCVGIDTTAHEAYVRDVKRQAGMEE